MPVYVAGPIRRPWRPLPNWVVDCYDTIERLAQRSNFSARRPYVEEEIDILKPKDFRLRVQKRIDEADSIVAVFLPSDPSVSVECAIAALMGRPVLLIHNERYGVPRILSGLEGVTVERWGNSASETILGFLLRS